MSREKAQEPVSGTPEAAAVAKDTNPVKKRKKNAPDRPQPEWMFPPDEENPVLNPKPKTDEQVRKDKEEREESIKFLHYRSVTAPMKAPPPGQLLTLVGAFLTSYGFNSASRLYTAQCKARKKLDAWDHELDAKLPKGHPDLVKIYRDWQKEYQMASESEDSANSSDEAGSVDNVNQTSKSQNSKKVKKQQEKEEETSSSGGSVDSDDSDARPPKKSVKSVVKLGKKVAKATSPSTSTSSSSSESDADDEKETASAKAMPPKPIANGLVSKSKRKASSPATSDSESTSEASSSGDKKVPPAKKAKLGAEKKLTDVKAAGKSSKATKEPAKAIISKKAAVETSSDSSTSSESEDAKGGATKKPLSDLTSEEDSSSSESDAAAPTKLPTVTNPSKVTLPAKKSPDSSIPTDSSATLDIASDKKTSSSSNSSSSAAEANSPIKQEPKTSNIKSEPEPAPKRKRSLSPHSARQAMTPQKIAKTTDTRFQRVPKDTKVDPKLASNAYVSYDYADRAHKDLIVTKGKDFTKEKNKKKRGSYRGGAIDVDGRNGIKFED